MIAAAEHNVPALLEMNGAHVHGRRADCPECGRPRAVSFSEAAFCCHGIDCTFRGGIGTLRKRLGLAREWLPPAEYRELCRTRERAHEAARRLNYAVHSRRMDLIRHLELLADLERTTHGLGCDWEASWDRLQELYGAYPATMAELVILENCRVPDLVRFLMEGAETRQAVIERVIARGGLYDAREKWIEVVARQDTPHRARSSPWRGLRT